MTYDTKTIFPAQENVDGKKHTTTKQQDTEEDIEKADVIKLYNSYREGGYDDMKPVMDIVEASGFDLTVTATLKVNSNTTTNLQKPNSWTNEDNVYKVNPKASSDNINDLKDLYDTLDKKGYEVDITIKPKAPKADDMDDENDSFANQLSAYPDGTLVTFRS